MKWIIAIVVVLMITGCEKHHGAADYKHYPLQSSKKAVERSKTEKELALDQMHRPAGYEVMVIDSCEYIVGWGGNGDGGPIMTHKGNCRYCKQRGTPVKQ